MVFEAPEGRAITKIEFTTGKTWTEPTYEPANNATAKKQWEGNAVKVTATIGKQCQINTITVTYANANEETIKPEVKVVTFKRWITSPHSTPFQRTAPCASRSPTPT